MFKKKLYLKLLLLITFNTFYVVKGMESKRPDKDSLTQLLSHDSCYLMTLAILIFQNPAKTDKEEALRIQLLKETDDLKNLILFCFIKNLKINLSESQEKIMKKLNEAFPEKNFTTSISTENLPKSTPAFEFNLEIGPVVIDKKKIKLINPETNLSKINRNILHEMSHFFTFSFKSEYEFEFEELVIGGYGAYHGSFFLDDDYKKNTVHAALYSLSGILSDLCFILEIKSNELENLVNDLATTNNKKSRLEILLSLCDVFVPYYKGGDKEPEIYKVGDFFLLNKLFEISEKKIYAEEFDKNLITVFPLFHKIYPRIKFHSQPFFKIESTEEIEKDPSTIFLRKLNVKEEKNYKSIVENITDFFKIVKPTKANEVDELTLKKLQTERNELKKIFSTEIK